MIFFGRLVWLLFWLPIVLIINILSEEWHPRKLPIRRRQLPRLPRVPSPRRRRSLPRARPERRPQPRSCPRPEVCRRRLWRACTEPGSRRSAPASSSTGPRPSSLLGHPSTPGSDNRSFDISWLLFSLRWTYCWTDFNTNLKIMRFVLGSRMASVNLSRLQK